MSRVSPPLRPVGTYSLRGDPNFSPNQLPRAMRLWHARLWKGIDKVKYSQNVLNPEDLAASGDLFMLGRFFNVYITNLLTALRVTGDLALLDEADRLLEIARGELSDPNADGFLNWTYETRTDSSSVPFLGDDYHVMDDILTHSMVAAVAAALHENAAFDARYAEHAAFWTDYLQNDFEAKWRQRQEVPFGFPFLSRNLTHPYVQFIRYHHYMYELTGDPAYEREAERRAREVTVQVREVFTPGGPAYVWDHRFLPEGDDNEGPLGCQPFVYLQFTFQAFQDLALEGGVGVFDNAFMQRVGTAMAELVMDDGYNSFAKDICGGVFQRGLFPTSGDRGAESLFMNYPYASVGKWDASGKIRNTVEDAFENADFDVNNPSEVNLSSAMLLMLANNPDGS